MYNGGYNDNYQQGATSNNRQSSQPNRSFGNCKTFNILDPYCRMRPDECNKLFQECMKFGQGQQSELLLIHSLSEENYDWKTNHNSENRS